MQEKASHDKLQVKKLDVQKKINQLRNLDIRNFEVWQFFESRADEIKGRLWTTATWLITLKGALLAFILSERMVQIDSTGVGLKPKFPAVVTMLSGLGLAFTILTLAIVDDMVKHIRRNWQRASALKVTMMRCCEVAESISCPRCLRLRGFS